MYSISMICILKINWTIHFQCKKYAINFVGLVTLDEMKAKQEDIVKKREKQLAKKNAEAQLIEKQKEDRKKKEKMKVHK